MMTFMMTVAAMGCTALAADSADMTAATAPAAETVTAKAAETTPAAGTKDCGMFGWLNVDTVTVAAADGDPVAQYTVAYLTDNGLADMPQDSEKAHGLYAAALPGLQQAAAAGNAHACRALSHMYAEGKGVEKDETKAAEYKAMCDKCCKGAKDAKDAPCLKSCDKKM